MERHGVEVRPERDLWDRIIAEVGSAAEAMEEVVRRTEAGRPPELRHFRRHLRRLPADHPAWAAWARARGRMGEEEDATVDPSWGGTSAQPLDGVQPWMAACRGGRSPAAAGVVNPARPSRLP